MRSQYSLCPVVMAVALLSGCAITRVDPPKPAPAPAAFKEAGQWQHAAPSAAVPDAWWTVFNDPVLNDLQNRLLVGNENIKTVLTQVANARATLSAADTALLPTFSVTGDGTRSASPAGQGLQRQAPGNNVSLTAQASWEIDLWGSLSQAISQAHANYQASSNDLAAAKLSAEGLLVQSYMTLRTTERQAALLKRSVDAYQRSLDLTQVRLQGGVAQQTDVLQAETQLHTTETQWHDTLAQRAQAEHAIAVLLGVPPSSLNLASAQALPEVPAVPELLPSTLLERRPDIAAAQQRVASAYAQIGIANAAYFPSLTLSASGGYRQSRLNNLISMPNLLWSIGPALTETIFDNGQRALASAEARNAADAATSTYRTTVLTALQEVEDNLVLAKELEQEARLEQLAVTAAERNLEITQDQYRYGTVSYLNVVTAQTAALTAESSLISVRDRQLVAISILLKNIAGRWDPTTR